MLDSDYLDKSESPPIAPEYIVPPEAPIVPAGRAELVQRALGIEAATAANAAARRSAFDRYRLRKADETKRQQDAALALFADFLHQVQIDVSDLSTDPAGWSVVRWGLVEAFVVWMLDRGYAIGSVNVRLSAIKTYAGLAAKAGTLDSNEAALIKLVSGYKHQEGTRVDKGRETTRAGHKKAEPVSISREHAQQLKVAVVGRDRLILCLLLDHGLRVGEVALLERKDFDLRRGVLRFHRPKVDKTQQHKLSTDTVAATTWLGDAPADGPIFPGERRIGHIVAAAGRAVGLDGLSPHDCRHAWATAATRAGTPLKALQDAGGWSSPAMPLRYAESQEIANEGVQLD